MPRKILYGAEVKLVVEVFRVGNLIIVKRSLKYVASKSILCFISINAKNASDLFKKMKFKILNFMQSSFREISLL